MAHYKRMLPMLSLAVLMILGTFPADSARAQDQPLFKVTIIAPGSANLLRRQWGQMFADSLQELGINASVVFLGWNEVYDRVLTPPPDRVGKPYDDGGYDILLVGWTPGLFPEPRQIFYGSPNHFAPNGQNYYLWQDEQSNQLLDAFITSTDVTERNQSLQEWQSVYYNEVPASQIFYGVVPALVTPELSGYSWTYFNTQPAPELLKGRTSIVYAAPGEIESLVPPLSNSWYDTIVFAPIFNGLAQVSNSSEAAPALLTTWNSSTDGFNWTFNLRQGVKWHDLYDFDADDVLFTLWALMNYETGSQYVGFYQSVFGNRVDFTWLNGTTTTLGTGTRSSTVTATDNHRIDVSLPAFTIGKPFGYFDPYLLTLANNIIPKHIFEKITPSQWASSALNTGVGSTTVPGVGTYTGPVGTGPYKWVSFDPAEQLVHLQKFNEYWNRSALEADGLFGVTDYYIKYVSDQSQAIDELRNDQVDIVDPNYFGLAPITPGDIDPSWATIFLLEDVSRQEIGYNMRHPVLGTGVDTPLGQADPSKAAEAARYVRIAFDYAIQRQLIIDDLLKGLGQPAATSITPIQPYYNSSIVARSYDLSKAKEYLEKAGYTGTRASFTYSPTSPTVGQNVTFDASNSYAPNGTIVSYSWDFGDGTSTIETVPTTTHVFWNASIFEVTLTVTDGSGHTARVTNAVKVCSPPFVSFKWTPERPRINETVLFEAFAYDPDGYVVGYKWDFGDGSYSFDGITQHVYAQVGTYEVTVVVTDNDGLTATAYARIIVAPRLVISTNPGKGIVGTTVSVIGVDATPNSIVEIYWGSYVNDYYGWRVNYTLIGTTLADSIGELSFSFEIPASTAGSHFIKAIDITTAAYDEKTFGVQPHISIDPASGPVGTKIAVTGTGFPNPYGMGPGYGYLMFDDQMYGMAMADQNGNMQATINAPFASAGPHAVKALVMAYFPYPEPSQIYTVEEAFTIIDTAPLDVTADVGAIYFKGETAEFYVQAAFKGATVDATSISVKLNKPDGTTQTLQVQKIQTGLYQVKYTISGKGSMTGTYTLSVEATYTTENINAKGTTIKTFIVKPTWEREAPKIAAFSIASIGLVGAMVLIWRKEKKRFL